MDKNYEKIKEEFIKVSSDTRNKLTALCITVIAGIYFFYPNETDDIQLLKMALFFYVLTISSEVIAGFLKSQHYALWFENKIDDIDYKNSWYGLWADRLFWLPVFTFVAGSIFFFVAILY